MAGNCLTGVGLWLTHAAILGREKDKLLTSAGRLLAFALLVQVLLGILTAAMRIPVALGALHQISAFLLLVPPYGSHSRKRLLASDIRHL